MAANLLAPAALTFSGHETFVLRSNWLKKAYDLLQERPDLFFLEDAFVRLGVGKNMAQSIRFWGRVCGVFERIESGAGHRATWLGTALFDDARGWDPFLVTPTSRWLLHWQIAARPEAAFTWYYTFNLLRRGEFTAAQLAQQVVQAVAQTGGKPPSPATIGRDVDCMLRCYLRPEAAQLGAAAEDALHCPLHELGLIQPLPGQPAYRLVSGARPDLPDQLVVFAALQQARALGRATIAFNELAYAERSPGRIFRLDEDALLSRLLRFEGLTAGRAVYTESGGIRQVAWRTLGDESLDRVLLDGAFAEERRYA
ncbi:MAG TPA: DUF4007 family protein [Roseiflexaceae bacterium]|nr:DUF4007 family protein [Roseiflexaceae bacterium]